MYNAKYKANQVIVGEGHTVVVAGWTIKELIAKRLESNEYAAIGQLYSARRGLSVLLRNILLNPHVTHVAAIAGTKYDENAGSIEALSDFFANGVEVSPQIDSETEKEKWRVRSRIKSYIDLEIPREVLEDLRTSILFFRADTMTELIPLVQTLSRSEGKTREAALTFPETDEVNKQILPGPLYGHRIEADTVAEAWVKLLYLIRTTGTLRPTGYGGQWQELIDLVTIVNNEPEDYYFPEPNYLPYDREFLVKYIPQVVEDSPYKEGVKYTYGQRIRSWFGQDQVEKVITKLIKEIDAASAVINLWDSGTGVPHLPEDNNNPLADKATKRFGRGYGDSDHDHGGSPCLNHLWFRVVDGVLSMTALLRSNDMYSAWASNAMGLIALQRHVRDELAKRSQYDLKLGPLITISQSAHIYDDCFENVDSLILRQYGREQVAFDDPTGNFLVEIEDGKIHLTHTSPSGEEVNHFWNISALSLIRQVVRTYPNIERTHLAYLGTEVQKAEMCLRGYLSDYTQDKIVKKIRNRFLE